MRSILAYLSSNYFFLLNKVSSFFWYFEVCVRYTGSRKTFRFAMNLSHLLRSSSIFSERDTYVHVRYAVGRPSVCRLSVTLVLPTPLPVEVFGIFFSPYDTTGTLVF